jgi:hypothetical protein
MRITYPLYEGDGYLHFRAAPASARKPELSGTDIRAIEARARALRRETVSALLTRFGQWLEARLRPGVRRDVETYLAQSTDHADLERRLRDVERKNQLGYCGAHRVPTAPGAKRPVAPPPPLPPGGKARRGFGLRPFCFNAGESGRSGSRAPSSPATRRDAPACASRPSRSARSRARPPIRPKRSSTSSGRREIP